MSTNRALLFRLAALVVVLLIVAGCWPLPQATPTATRPTAAALLTFTPTPSATAGATARPLPTATASATSTPLPATATSTQPPVAPTAQPTNTPVPSTAMAQPTNTPVPPTAMAQPTNTPVPPTAMAQPTDTPVPPTATARPTNTRVSPTVTSTPPRITDWRGEYYDNWSLQPPAVVVRNDRVVDFGWGAGQSPAPGIPSENYAVRWTRDWSFETGNYRFQLVVDDGARLWVGGTLIIDAWNDGAPREYSATLYLQGQVPIRLEYYNHLGSGRARLNWDRVTSYPDWLGSYYKGRELTGPPYFQRNDPSIDFNWGAGAPRSDMPVDSFSVRWSRRLNLDRAGIYRFQIVADDGVRFWVDGRLVVDAWSDGHSEHDVSLELVAGGHDLRLDYYEHLGGALIRLVIAYVAAPATATFTPTPTATGQPPTATFTPTATGQPPTATFTPTATGQPPTATFTPTATGQPPTATFTPTPAPPTLTPPPLVPRITLEPIQDEQGRALQVIGRGWPANTQVDLFLNRIAPEGEASTGVGQVTTSSEGDFQARVDLLPLQEFAGAEKLEIVARTADGAYEARASVQILSVPTQVPTAQPSPQATPGSGMGGQLPVPFDPIQASAERFALSEATYLVLDSAAAWAEHFGAEPPPADPSVDWQQEYVLGAFLGAQPPEVDAAIEAVTARDGTITVQLSSPISGVGVPAEGQQNLPRALIRISRAEVERAVGGAAEPSFAFVDAGGALLAQGTPGAQPLGAAVAMLSAPAPAEPGAVAMPRGEESAELAAAPEAEAAKEAPAEEALPEAASEPVAEAEVQAESAPSTADLIWLSLGLWVIVVAALAVGMWLLIRRMRRD